VSFPSCYSQPVTVFAVRERFHFPSSLIDHREPPIHFLLGRPRDTEIEKSRPFLTAADDCGAARKQGLKRPWGCGWAKCGGPNQNVPLTLPSSLRPEHHTTACNCCSTSIASIPHIHRHWPPCLPPYRPRRSHSHSAPPLAPRQLPKQRSRPLPPTRTISSGPTPKSRMQRGGRQSLRRTRRYIPPKMRGIGRGHTKLTRLHRF
jgi:hypothetical protein